jgi:hypothetical protein
VTCGGPGGSLDPVLVAIGCQGQSFVGNVTLLKALTALGQGKQVWREVRRPHWSPKCFKPEKGRLEGGEKQQGWDDF